MQSLHTTDKPLTERGARHRPGPKESRVKINLDKVCQVFDDIRLESSYQHRLDLREDFLRTMLFALSSYVRPADWDAALEEGKKALARARK